MEINDTMEDFILWELEIVMDEVGIGTDGGIGGEITDDTATEIKDALKGYIVDVDPDDPTACIDGRECVELLDGAPTTPRAKMAGGSALGGFVGARLAGSKIISTDNNDNPEAQISEVIRTLDGSGQKVGGHISNVANLEGGSSTCGAADKLVPSVRAIGIYREQIQAATESILGFSQEGVFDRIAANSAELANDLETSNWNGAKLINKLVEDSDAKESGVEVLEGHGGEHHHHEEAMVVVNYKRGTTLDRDAFVKATGKQVFWIDAWKITDTADKLSAGNEDEFKAISTAMVAHQLGTYATLCDGKHRVATFKES